MPLELLVGFDVTVAEAEVVLCGAFFFIFVLLGPLVFCARGVSLMMLTAAVFSSDSESFLPVKHTTNGTKYDQSWVGHSCIKIASRTVLLGRDRAPVSSIFLLLAG